jgi:hypothetical protein
VSDFRALDLCAKEIKRQREMREETMDVREQLDLALSSAAT